MNRKLSLYGAVVICVAIGSALGLYLRSPVFKSSDLFAILLLSVLAVVSELLAFVLPNSARGSIAFIPYLAAALTVPTWATVVAVTLVKALVETIRRSSVRTALFNIGLSGFTVSGTIWVYSLLGGRSLLVPQPESLFAATLNDGWPALVAVTFSFFANTSVACGYLAIRSQQRAYELWRQSVLPTFGIDLVAGPIVFVFAWLYAAHGAIAAAALWVPLLGLREVQRANLELQRTNEELLQLMIKSIEARDLYTSGHSRRVQKYSTAIARGLGLSERDVEQISKAALLHEVGKIHVHRMQ